MPNPNRGPFAEEGVWNDKPSITLKWRADSQYPFSMGIGKVRLVLACIEELKAFAAKHPDEGVGNRGRGRPAPPPASVGMPGHDAAPQADEIEWPGSAPAPAPAQPRPAPKPNDGPPC